MNVFLKGTFKSQFYRRLYQAAKLYLFSPSSGLYSCPLAMTDGAASILKVEKFFT